MSRRRWTRISIALFVIAALLTVGVPWVWAIVGITQEVGVATTITVGVLIVGGLVAGFRADTLPWED